MNPMMPNGRTVHRVGDHEYVVLVEGATVMVPFRVLITVLDGTGD